MGLEKLIFHRESFYFCLVWNAERKWRLDVTGKNVRGPNSGAFCWVSWISRNVHIEIFHLRNFSTLASQWNLLNFFLPAVVDYLGQKGKHFKPLMRNYVASLFETKLLKAFNCRQYFLVFVCWCVFVCCVRFETP